MARVAARDCVFPTARRSPHSIQKGPGLIRSHRCDQRKEQARSGGVCERAACSHIGVNSVEDGWHR
eukprot:11951495-Alexandrium_andersonii.AAC.1